jgi:hypothetical protein
VRGDGQRRGRASAEVRTRAFIGDTEPVGVEAPPFWLAAEPEDVTVERGGAGANGRRRSAALDRRGRRRRIVRAAGPWRLIEPWAEMPVARDGYHVVTTDGAAWWLVYDHLEERWRLLGTFD